MWSFFIHVLSGYPDGKTYYGLITYTEIAFD